MCSIRHTPLISTVEDGGYNSAIVSTTFLLLIAASPVKGHHSEFSISIFLLYSASSSVTSATAMSASSHRIHTAHLGFSVSSILTIPSSAYFSRYTHQLYSVHVFNSVIAISASCLLVSATVGHVYTCANIYWSASVARSAAWKHIVFNLYATKNPLWLTF